MEHKIYVLNGPNLNRLGKREPHIYGHETLEMLKDRCLRKGATLGLEIDFRQTNFEGVLIESVHEATDTEAAGIIINPAGLTFTSVSLMDALKMFDGPKVELHISNVHKREEVYHDSLVSAPVTAVMAGFGTDGYLLALDWMQIGSRRPSALAIAITRTDPLKIECGCAQWKYGLSLHAF